MKTIKLLLLSLIVLSCGNSKEEQMLTDYVSKGIKNFNINITDTDFKIKSVVKITDIQSNDSLDYVTEYFQKKKLEKINYFKENIAQTQDLLKYDEEQLEKETYENIKNIYLERIEEKKISIESYGKYIDLYNGDCKGTFLELVLIKINAYKKNPDSILSTKYQVKYSMTNPLLNIKQTFDKVLYTDSGQIKFIKEELVD